MALRQSSPVVPPLDTDKQLVDFAGVIQSNLMTLFQVGHVHVGSNGVLTAPPTKNQGAVGDIVIGVVSGSAYIYFKTDATTWYRLGAATKV